MTSDRISKMTFASVYPLYIAKVELKGHTRAQVDEVVMWLTGYSEDELAAQVKAETTFKEFFDSAPKLNPNRRLITGLICGVRVEEITEPLMQEIRYLDKLIDEVAKGRAMAKILRSSE